jgi:hypothetical protein
MGSLDIEHSNELLKVLCESIASFKDIYFLKYIPLYNILTWSFFQGMTINQPNSCLSRVMTPIYLFERLLTR